MNLEHVIGHRVQKLRNARRWTQEELANRLNGEGAARTTWIRQTVSAAEKGRRHWVVAELFQVARVLGVSVGELTDTTEPVDVGGIIASPEEVRATFTGAATLREARLALANLHAMANVLRELTNVYAEGVANFRAQYGGDDEVMSEVRRGYEATRKRVRGQLNEAIKTERGAARVTNRKAHEERLAEYGFLEVPEIRVGNDILKEQQR